MEAPAPLTTSLNSPASRMASAVSPPSSPSVTMRFLNHIRTTWNPQRRKTLAVLGFYFLVAVYVTYPTILYPFHLVPGEPRSDIWDHLWGYWRTEKAFFSDQTAE